MRKKYIGLGLAIALAVLCLDQLTKWLVMDHALSPERPFIEVTSFFNLVLVWNHGISFGMFAGMRQPVILVLVSLLVTAILCKWLYNGTSRLVACALGSVIGGALGNVIDRLRFEAVADFLDFHIANYHWPAFNIADSCIFIGVVLLCVSSMFMESSDKLQ
jgi:signal peptidase II